jgi:hypothetical protein
MKLTEIFSFYTALEPDHHAHGLRFLHHGNPGRIQAGTYKKIVTVMLLKTRTVLPIPINILSGIQL